MVDKRPDSLLNNLKKKNNPFKKILEDVRKFIKKDDEKDKKPSSFEAPKKVKREEDMKSRSFEASKKKKREKNKKPSSFKESRNGKNPELNQQPENSDIPKIETSETKEAERSMRERKGRIKEQKLPEKFRKGW
jgi:hypothetical protein